VSTPESTSAGSPFDDDPLDDALTGDDASDDARFAGTAAARESDPDDRSAARPDDGSADGPDDGSADGPDDGRDLVDIPAVEVISRAAVLLMSAAAEQLGLGEADPDKPQHRDLDQARTLITALAGLVKASAPDLGPHAAAFRDGLAGLQGAFREYSIHPDEPGRGPGE
jgi:hypothetical protein